LRVREPFKPETEPPIVYVVVAGAGVGVGVGVGAGAGVLDELELPPPHAVISAEKQITRIALNILFICTASKYIALTMSKMVT
jgi:hypothetical protein